MFFFAKKIMIIASCKPLIYNNNIVIECLDQKLDRY